VQEAEVISVLSRREEFEGLAKGVRDAIEKNEPESGLDRLHTFTVRFTRCPYQKPPFVRVLLTTKLIRLPEPIGFVWNAMGRLRSTAQTDQANGTSR
jgi:hypothetical protein